MILTYAVVVVAGAFGAWCLWTGLAPLRQRSQLRRRAVHAVKAGRPAVIRPLLEPAEQIATIDLTQAEHKRITDAARARMIERDFDGELAAVQAVADSWRDRCLDLARERDDLRAELAKRGAVV
jgi:hypothetical protein